MSIERIKRSIARFEKVSYKEFEKSIDSFVKELYNNGLQIPEGISNYENIYNNIKLPARATTGSAGYDFFAPFDFNISKSSITIPTGIRCVIDDGWFLACYPRSGLGFKYRAQLDNSVGIIDSDYYYSDNEGHIKIKMHLDVNSTENKVLIQSGKGFIQGIFSIYGLTVDDNAKETRNGGFGSTDNK